MNETFNERYIRLGYLTQKQTISNCAIRYIRSLGNALVKYCNVVKLYMVVLLPLIHLSERVEKIKALL